MHRGTTCNGMLKPQGSGTEDNRIFIGAYGDGPLPRIDAQGLHSAAVHIEDMSYVVVQDLELTNPGNLSEPHRGVYLTAAESTVTNVEIRDLYIHDVTGLVTFNGTFVAANPHTALETSPFESLPNAGNFQFTNNIIYATSPQTTLIGCGDRCTNNLFHNLPPVGTEFVVGDPLFEDVSWRGSGRLEAEAAFRISTGSPAFAAGLGVVDPPQKDYFGDEIPMTPSIGMHQPH